MADTLLETRPWRANSRFAFRPALLLLGADSGALDQLRRCFLNNYTLSSADSIEHGIVLAQLLTPVATFVAGSLRDGSARQFLERLKRDVSLSAIPIILTASSEQEAQQLKATGAATVLSKPLRDPEVLAAASVWAKPWDCRQHAVQVGETGLLIRGEK